MCVCVCVCVCACMLELLGSSVCLRVSLDCCSHLDGRITGVVSGMERLEARRVNLKETYEKQRVDVMSISRELQHTESSLKQKVGGVMDRHWWWKGRGGSNSTSNPNPVITPPLPLPLLLYPSLTPRSVH